MATRSVKEPIILVTQTNKFPFVSRSFLKIDDGFWNFFAKTQKGSPEKYYVRKDGSLFQKIAWPKKYAEDETDFIQIITLRHIPKGGLFETDAGPEKMPPKLYKKILQTGTDEELSQFIEKYDFCDFPLSENELMDKNDPYLKKFSPKKGVRGSNWLHIYRRRYDLSSVYESLQNNDLSINEKNYLQNGISKNVFPFSFDKNSLPFREIENFDGKYKLGMDEIFGFKKLNKIEQIDGYVIFGHYSLCCLEFLKDMDKQRFCIEKDCRKPLPIDAHGNQKRCNPKDNPDCQRNYKRRARKEDRQNEKIRGKKQRKKIPKRNLN